MSAAAIWQRLYDVVLSAYEENLDIVTSEHGLTGGDVKAMLKLDPDEGAPMRAVAERWHADASTATWLVDRLERHGLVERQPDPSDRRVRLVVLTAKGRATFDQVRMRIYRPPAAWSQLSAADLDCLDAVVARLD